MRYPIFLILTLLLSSPARADDGLWTSFRQRVDHVARDLFFNLREGLHDLDLKDRATKEILVAAELLSRRGAHPGERIEMAAAVAAAWAEGGRPDEARRVLARFAGEVDRIPTKATKNRASYELGKAWAALGDGDRVEAIAEEVSRPDAILAELGAVRGEAGDLGAARALAARIKDPAARSRVMGRAAQALSGRGDHDGALALLDEITDIPWRTSVIQAVGVAHAEAGRCAAGRAVADQLLGVPGIDPKTIDLSGGLARRSPHPRVLAKVATACARGGDADAAEALAAAVPPGRRQVEALAGIAAVVKDDARARTLLAEARGRAGEIEKPGVRALALVSVADAWTARGNTAEAIAVLDAAWDVGQEVEKPGLGDARLQILADLGAAGRCGDADIRARAFKAPFWGDGALASAARGCAKSGEIEKALALAAATHVPLWRANAYQEIALARLAAGDLITALEVVARIPSERGRLKALAAVGAAHLKAGGAPAEGTSTILARLLEDR
ncbi:MAG: hypothetical protein ABIK09_12890 [Pseudomonadota bacterium]